MEDKLRRYIEGLFKDVPSTKNVVELKEEMYQNLMEKYEDLIKEGKGEEAAYNIAVAGIGDINELIDDMEKVKKDSDSDNDRRKSAALTSIAVMLYILSIIPILISINTALDFLSGLIGFFVLITAATGMLVYNYMTKPRYIRREDTMVAEFKEWQANKDNMKSARGSVSVAVWCLAIVLYIFISFSTNDWHITWVIFVIAVAVEAIINIIMNPKK